MSEHFGSRSVFATSEEIFLRLLADHGVRGNDEMTASQKILEDLGLSAKQCRVYLALLKTGETTISALARAAGLKRPTTYLILDQLESGALLARRKDGSREYIRALSPYTLLEQKTHANERFAAHIPELLSLATANVSVPMVEIITGPEDIERSMRARLLGKTELYFWADNNFQYTHYKMVRDVQVNYMKSRIALGKWTRGIVPYEPKRTALRNAHLLQTQKRYLELKRRGAKEFREFVFVPRRAHNRQSEVWIYDDIVEFYSSSDFIGARIRSEPYADSMRAVFLTALAAARLGEAELLHEQDRKFLRS